MIIATFAMCAKDDIHTICIMCGHDINKAIF